MYKRKGRKADLPRFMTVGTTFLVIKKSDDLSMKKAVMSGIFLALFINEKGRDERIFLASCVNEKALVEP